ncbi:MAG: precorrin-6y C5,15-methyltransferase (decarboxylating) subunit CbiE [Planctomycetales bacterium]|nr:precorrin-6y C5,15-methyltransferase (decarboxylating) subunit CbiE [Planctomycetales bacterium]
MPASQPPLSILGLGDDGFDAAPESVKQRIRAARLVAGHERTLALIEPSQAAAERLVLGTDLEAAVDRIAAALTEGPAVVVVSGDPLFYGLARFFCEKLGAERCEIVPHVSSMQLALARVKESWDEAYLTNLANHSIDTVVEKLRTAPKAGLFTTEECGPAEVARRLLARNIDYFTAYVCENLGARNECVTRGSLAEFAGQSFGPLNVMILVRSSDAPDSPRDPAIRSLFGNPDELFIQSKPKHGLLTPAEVRSVALAQLALSSQSTVWDVGAGSGSVSVEAALLAPGGHVFAIEQDGDDAELIRDNAARFGVSNVTPVVGRAPECWDELPDPDAVFIEGSGREVSRLADLAFARLRSRGRLVASVRSIEGVHEVRQALKAKDPEMQVLMLNLARGTDQLDRLRFDAINPAFLVSASKL